MTLLRAIYELFPPKGREKLKSIFSTQGHGASQFDSLKARDHALGKKRLDRVAEAILPVLSQAGITSLRDRACLEFGAGYTPTEVLVFHLLGARLAVATDYNAIARLGYLIKAARAADRDRTLELLAPFADGLDLEQRLDAILRAAKSEANTFLSQNIIYIAPHDMSAVPIQQQFDLIHSVSVFEHLPPMLAEPILRNLVKSLAIGGKIITEIDLRDHLDFDKGPLDFLSQDDRYDPAVDFDRRGNRLRRSEWLEIFRQQAGLVTLQAYEKTMSESVLPVNIAPKFRLEDNNDMLVSWVGLVSTLES